MNRRKFKNVNNEIGKLLTDEARELFDDSTDNVLYQKYNGQYRLVGYHENDYMVKNTTLENIAEILEQDYLDYVEFLKKEGYIEYNNEED